MQDFVSCDPIAATGQHFMVYNQTREVFLRFTDSEVAYTIGDATPSLDKIFSISKVGSYGVQIWNSGNGKCLVDLSTSPDLTSQNDGPGLGMLDHTRDISDNQVWLVDSVADGNLLINRSYRHRLTMWGDSRGLGVLGERYKVYPDQIWTFIPVEWSISTGDTVKPEVN